MNCLRRTRFLDEPHEYVWEILMRLPCFSATLIVVFLFVVGCSQDQEHQEEGASIGAESGITGGGLYIKHHFGVARPSQRFTHEFVVKNDTNEDWVFGEILNDCSCTVLDLPADRVPAHGVAKIPVHYRAPSHYADDARIVGIRLKDTDKAIKFGISCAVRELVTVQPESISLRSDANKRYLEDFIEVSNYDSVDKNIAVSSSTPECLQFEVATVPVVQGWLQPRQKWRIALRFDSDKSPPVSKRYEIEIHSGPGERSKIVIPVLMEVVPDVQVVPSRIFLGEIHSGETVSKNLFVQLSSECDLADPEATKLAQDDFERVGYVFRSIDNKRWNLEIEILPFKNGGLISGVLDFEFVGINKKMAIPVVGKVVD